MRVVVFGAGYWGQNYIRELGRHCVFVVDSDPGAQLRATQRFGVPAASCLLLDEDSFDAAIIATPPATHYDLALPLLEVGKYVLIEKPMCTNYEDALELALNFPRCMSGMVYLYHPEVERLRDIAATGKWSHLYSRRTNDGPVRPYLDALWDLAPHDISIFNFVTQSTPDFSHAIKDRDWAILTLDYPHVTAMSYVSWHGSPKVRRVEMVPTSGARLIFDDLITILEEPPLTRMVKAFLSGSWDRCTASEGAEVVRILEAVSE